VIRQDSVPLHLEVQHCYFRSVEVAVVQSELAVLYLLLFPVRTCCVIVLGIRILMHTVVQSELATSYPLLLQVQGNRLRLVDTYCYRVSVHLARKNSDT